ncbi:uncharacterized protein TOT_040000468 [Theileria orientalis strain Shintoku]|uniref:C3H1-type domain-containing protein n=1 Tax=Theileria orientalis strain Shintoku TaxID=869250 RepID=J4CE13_THEOR|nr:uncharacterized protein TOT_040000468 [Theileria orientalis strain Shintoku]BAM42092.1 uncharacterized protein TOT_040000468 [Theileria orientalis strain Shintoku]|eukprot:XP_009692393.1 uncharacterized protein TOT_040000468 [Theileria orientalis strain Shintoku]
MYNRRTPNTLESRDVSNYQKRKTRSSEGYARHKQRYDQILERRKQIEAVRSERDRYAHTETRYNRNQYKDKSMIICRYFYRYGKCTKGDACLFSHDCTPLNSKDLKLCHYFVKSEGCKKSAEECKYSHEIHKFLCRQNVIAGFCNQGGKCQFNHLPIESIRRMDDTEKLKFCYNNKKFLVKSLINYLINDKWIKPQEIGVCDDIKGVTAIVTAYNKIPDHVVKTIPWYLHYTLLILEKDMNTMQQQKQESNE